MKILVLDAETKQALATIRSLGRAGHRVTAVSSSKRALGFASRYTAAKLISPNPRGRPEIYQEFLREALRSTEAELLVPLSADTLQVVLDIEDDIRKLTSLPCVSKDVLELISDKHQVLGLARELGIKVPSAVDITASMMETPHDLADAVKQVRFPAVAKPLKNVVRVANHVVRPHPRYLESARDAFTFFKDVRSSVVRDVPHVLQQVVEGKSLVVNAVCAQGEPLMTFAYRRLLERSPGSNESVVSEGVKLTEAPIAPALSLLRHLEWQGFASLEFCESADGRQYLLDIHPVPSESLHLAIESGYDFPRALVQMTECEREGRSFEAIAGVLQNEVPKPLRLRSRLGTVAVAKDLLKAGVRSGLREIFLQNRLQFSLQRSRYELLSWSDYRPAIVAFENAVSGLFLPATKKPRRS